MLGGGEAEAKASETVLPASIGDDDGDTHIVERREKGAGKERQRHVSADLADGGACQREEPMAGGGRGGETDRGEASTPVVTGVCDLITKLHLPAQRGENLGEVNYLAGEGLHHQGADGGAPLDGGNELARASD